MEGWELRKDFLLFTAEEETALKSLQPLMKRHVDELVDAFYRHLLSFAETRRLLSDETVAEIPNKQENCSQEYRFRDFRLYQALKLR